jgi:hypothetical protein
MKVELKSIKEAGGEETPRFEAVLWLDGVKAAVVSNDGRGGSNRYHWFDQEFGRSLMREEFAIYAKEQLPNEKFEVEDQIIYGLLDEAASKKKLKRLCGKKTLAHLPGQRYGAGEWSVFNAKFTQVTKTQLETKYPGIVFANEGL